MRNWLLLLVLLAVTISIFASIGDAGHLAWDDDSNIFGNPYFTMHYWYGVWNEPYFGLYVPITSSVWALLFNLGKGAAWPFRVLNLSLHAINIVFVFLILNSLSKRWRLRCPIAAALAVGVFALHPLQVESVAWISGGRDLLSAFFALGATLIYFRWRNPWARAGAALIFILALLSKPSVVVLPLVFLVAEIFVYRQPWKKTLLWLSPWFLLALAATVVTHAAQVGHFVDGVALIERPWIMADSYFFYVEKTIWPNPLSGNYAHTPEAVMADLASVWKPILLVALVLAGLWLTWKKDRRLGIGLIWFILLLPVSGVVGFAYENISGVADHYIYLPMVVTAILLMLLWEQLWRVRALIVIPFLLCGAWAFASYERLGVWVDDTNFFMDMAKNAPDSYNTAIGMSVVMCQDQKDYLQGIKWTDKALELHNNDIMALANRAFCLLHAGRTRETVDMDVYLQKLNVDDLATNQPTSYSSLLASIGGALLQESRWDEGFQYLCEAYRVKPSEPNHARNLEVAKEILKTHGVKAECDELFAPAEAD